MMANTDGDDVCPQLSASLECVRNIWQALQTINVKINTIVALCDCHSNIANQSQSAHTCRELISKSKRLRAELDSTHGRTDARTDSSEASLECVVKVEKAVKVTPKRSAASTAGSTACAKRRHVCWYEGCGGAFRSYSNLMAHIAKHTGEKAFVCEWPGMDTTDRHCIVCVACLGCGKEFPYKRSLDRHVEALHLRSARFSCEWPACDACFITKNQLDCHMTNAHTGEKLYKCSETDCQFETNYLKHMKDHKLRHDPNHVPDPPKHRQIAVPPEGPLDEDFINKKTGRPLRRKRRPMNHRCSWPKCEYMFDSPNALQKHMRVHTGERPYRCEWPGCERQFRYSHTVRVHVEMIHLMLKKYKCNWPACEAAFVSQIQLDVHSSDVHIGTKKFKCDWPGCDWIGTNHARELRFHKLRRHENVKIVRTNQLKKERAKERKEKKHVCTYADCGKYFMYKSALVKHMRCHRPTGEKLVACDYPGCGKRFAAEENLVRHKLVHDPNKKFVCDWPECAAAYHSRVLLESHIHAKHTGERPFACEWPACGATFTYKSNWRMHYKNVHEMTEKPFHCDWQHCQKAFVKRKTLVEHIEKKHLHSKNPNLQFMKSMDY